MDSHLREASVKNLIAQRETTKVLFCSSNTSKTGRLALLFDCKGNFFVECAKLNIKEVFSIPQNAIRRYRSIYLENRM